MINYFIIQLKNKFLGKKNMIILLSIIILSIGLTYAYHISQEQNIYKAGIVDLDQSEASRNIINVLKNQEEINLIVEESNALAEEKLKSGDYHILYIIENGFEDALKAGEYKDLLGYSKESSMQITAWLNDFISLKVLKEWAYYDLYNLINEESLIPYTYEDYSKAYNENLKDNEIISLTIENLDVKENVEGNQKKIFVSIFSVFIMLVTMSYGKEVINEKNMKIVERLKISGISEYQYLASKGIILLTYLLTTWAVSSIGLLTLEVFKSINLFIDLLAFIGFIIINYLLTLIIAYLSKDKGKYLLITQGYILFSVLMSSDLFKGNLPLVNQMKAIFPLTYLFNIIL